MQTTLELLGAQHQEVLARLSRVEAELHDSRGDLGSFADFLAGEVLEHFAIEEEALFPLLARHVGEQGGPLAVMNAEHALFRDLLRRLTEATRTGDGTGQRGAATELIALLRGHIQKEDGVLFPLASRLLSADEVREMDGRTAALSGTAAKRAS